MTRASAFALLFSSMALSALTLALPLSGSSCACFMNWCEEQRAAPACCPTANSPYFYTCNVEMEGPTKGAWTAIEIPLCGASKEDALAAATEEVAAQYPDKIPGAPSQNGCWLTTCPSTGSAP